MATTILITGSLGYIGSRLSSYLVKHGFRCIGYDTGFFKECTLYAPQDPPTRLKDTREFQEEDLGGVDAVVHLAGISNDPFGNLRPELIYDPTRTYAVHVARLCKKRGVTFIFASSCSVYGIGRDQLMTEASETFPQTPYSLNKLQIESDLQKMSDRSFCPIILRFATVFGLSSRMRFDIVTNMFVGMALTTRRIILNSNGKPWRPHVHIDDVCKAIRCCVEQMPRSDGALIVNVGDTQQNFQILDVAEMTKAQVSQCEIIFLNAMLPQNDQHGMELIRDRKVQDGVDNRTYKVSFELIKEILPGFHCDWTVPRGIQSMIEAFKELQLAEGQLKNINFYRLQKLESLLKSGYLSEDLYWTRHKQPALSLTGWDVARGRS